MSANASEFVSDFRDSEKRGVFGGITSSLSYLTPKHWQGALSGGVDLLYRAPRAQAYEGAYLSVKDKFFKTDKRYSGVVEATKSELSGFWGETWADIKSVADVEIFKDLSKPLSYGFGHANYKIFQPLLSTLRDPIQLTGYIKIAGGILGMIPAVATGTLAMMTHLIPDIISLPQHMLGSVSKTVSGVLRRGFAIAESVGADIPILGTLNRATTGLFRRFFAAAEEFGKQTLVSSDLVERGFNKLLVPVALREGHRYEHPYLTQWAPQYAEASEVKTN